MQQNPAPASAGAIQARRLPGLEGVWVFIAADMAMFAMLFASFATGRSRNPGLFDASARLLNADLGGINTLILVTSSWFVVLALQAVRRGRLREAPLFLALATTCGLAFCAVKLIEYGAKLHAGISVLSNDFFMYYFMLTGIHFLHVLAGCVVLTIVWRRARRHAYQAGNCTGLETAASYWHMVDLLWIMLFPLLYLIR